MAVTVSQIARTVFGNKRVVLADVTFDTSYPAGGEPLSAADLGLSVIEAVLESAGYDSATPAVRHVKYDKSTGNLLAFLSTDLEVAAATDLSAFTVTIQAIGL